MNTIVEIYITKALDSLAGAHSEQANGRFDNCANRCYYACFQAAIAALMDAGHVGHGTRDLWGHDIVQAQFAGELIRRRKLYPGALRDALTRLYELREKADYAADRVSDVQAARALRRAQEFVLAVEAGLREGSDQR